jgi:hypothetical protein
VSSAVTRIRWLGTLAEARADARERRRPILVFPCGQGLVAEGDL